MLTQVLPALLATGFSAASGEITLAGLPQPTWVHSDGIQAVILCYSDEKIEVQIGFEHHRELLKYGSDPETLLGMKQHCSAEWFPELEQRFSRVAAYYGLQWDQNEHLDDGVVPIMGYCLSGKFGVDQTDRIIALLLEVRAVLSSNS